MTSDRPSWLAGVQPVRVAGAAPGPIAAGDIRRADPMDSDGPDSRLVLVTRTDEDAGSAAVMLLSPEVDMGAAADARLDPVATGLTYPLIAQTDVQAPVWFVQLGPAVAALDLAGLPAPDAPAVTDELDPRWTWKEAELDALHALAGECLRQTIDGPGPALVDPQCLDPEAVDRDDLWSVALTAADLARAGDVIVPTWTLVADEAMPPALDAWRGRGDVDVFGFLAAVLAAGGGAYPQRPPGPQTWHIAGRRPVHDDPLAAVLADRVSRGCTSVRLVTTAALWDAAAEGTGPAGRVVAATVGNVRCQIVCRPVEEERSGV